MESFTSPRWNAGTKLVVALTMVAIIAALVIKFQGIVSPLILAFTLVYLLYPAANFLRTRLRMGWGVAVALVYLGLTVVLLASLTFTGFEVLNQLKSVFALVETSLQEIPDLVERISSFSIQLGPLHVDFSALDLNVVSSQVIETVRPMLGQTGDVLGAFASGAVNTLGWTFFIMLVSYFMLAESNGLRDGILHIQVPGYQTDMDRMMMELGRIWNAFLRGQLFLVAMTWAIYSVILTGLGVRYAIGLALLAGLARFLPYVGPAISWTTLALVAFFQVYKPDGLTPFAYTLVVVIVALVVDGILDNYVSPRIMADTLQVHPAAVLVAAIIALDLLGLLGVMIAAPFLATAQLIGRYFSRKLFDLDPWEGLQESPTPPPFKEQVQTWWQNIRKKLKLDKTQAEK